MLLQSFQKANAELRWSAPGVTGCLLFTRYYAVVKLSRVCYYLQEDLIRQVSHVEFCGVEGFSGEQPEYSGINKCLVGGVQERLHGGGDK